MMQPNVSVTIEQVGNGFVVRPLAKANEPATPGEAVVHHDLDALRAWIDRHFSRGICPKCGRPAQRADHLIWQMPARVYACWDCGRITEAGMDHWIEFDPYVPFEHGTIDRLRDEALEARRRLAGTPGTTA